MSKFWRQLDIINPDHLSKPVTIIGSGSVGSFSILSMAKVGIKDITVYDNDKVEEHNLPNQFFREDDLGKWKAESIKDILKSFVPETDVKVKNQTWTEEDELSGIVVAAVDSLDTRRKILEKCRYNLDVPRLIDARMGAEVMRIYNINPSDPDDLEFYEKTLSGEAEELPCTARTIIYNIEVIAGIVCAMVAMSMAYQQTPKEIVFDMKNWEYLKR